MAISAKYKLTSEIRTVKNKMIYKVNTSPKYQWIYSVGASGKYKLTY